MKRLWFLLICLVVWPNAGSAHVLHEYLQRVQLSVTPFSVYVELRLTPGVEIADRVLLLSDVDRDAELSFEEMQAYCQHVSENLTLEIDGRRVPLDTSGFRLKEPGEIKNGEGSIVLPFIAMVEGDTRQFTVGEHQITLRNDHLPELSAYQANVLVPRFETIKITAQHRDPLQRELRVHFHVDATIPLTTGTATAQPGWLDWTGVLLGGLFVTLLLGRRILRRLVTSHRTA